MVAQAHMHPAVQERAGGQHHRLATEGNAQLGDGARHPVHPTITFHHQIVHRLLKQPQIGLVLQPLADGGFVQHPVRLGPGGAHGRAFAAVQDAELDAGFVGGRRHGATQRVHLFDQMAFADAADGRVTAHLAQGLDVVRQQQGGAAHARSGQRGLGARMAAADHDDVKCLGVQHGLGWRGLSAWAGGAGCHCKNPGPGAWRNQFQRRRHCGPGRRPQPKAHPPA